MADKRAPLRILLVEDDAAAAKLYRWVLMNEGFEVLLASSGEEGYALASEQTPDLIIVDVLLPGMDGYALCRRLRQNVVTRTIPILLISAKSDIADKIAGLEAGADDYLAKPFHPEELAYRVKALLARYQSPVFSGANAYARGKIIAFFSSKGGVGKTTIAVNLAVAMRRQSGSTVALFDADFFFGNVGVYLNLPTVYSVLNLVPSADHLDTVVLDQVLLPHASGIRVLLSPYYPEEAELVEAHHVEKILGALAQTYSYVLVDCQASYDERTLTVLERADVIVLITTPEVGAIKNTSRFLELAEKLAIGPERVHILVNRSDSDVGVEIGEIERTLRHPVAFQVISGGRTVVFSVNRGIPLVMDHPGHPFSQQMLAIAEELMAAMPARTVK